MPDCVVLYKSSVMDYPMQQKKDRMILEKPRIASDCRLTGWIGWGSRGTSMTGVDGA